MEHAAPTPAAVVNEDRPCRRCGYNLRGLPIQAICPECGGRVADSLRQNLLLYTSLKYVTLLWRGVVTIEMGIALELLAIVLGVVLVAAAGPALGWNQAATWSLFSESGSLVNAVFSLVGWWMLSAPDPGTRTYEPSITPRRVLRVSVVLSTFAQAGAFIVQLLPGQASAQAPTWSPRTTNAVSLVVGLTVLAAWAVQFFAAMRYLESIGRRLPDESIVQRSRRYTWLLPLVYFVGAFCFFIGPLIALVLYVYLLDNLRVALGQTRRRVRTLTAQSRSVHLG